MSLAILQCEVNMAGGRWAAVGDLALNPQVGVVRLDVLADVGDQSANALDAALDSDGRAQSRLRLGLVGGERRSFASN